MGTFHKIENSVAVKRPVSVVWNIIARPRLYITYSEKFQFSDEKLRLGTTGEVTIGGPIYPVTYRFEVTKFEEEDNYTIEGETSRGWKGRIHTSLRPIEFEYTRITRLKEYELPFPGVLGSLLNFLFFQRRYMKTEIEELMLIKQLVESSE
jgi:hypothetical protein